MAVVIMVECVVGNEVNIMVLILFGGCCCGDCCEILKLQKLCEIGGLFFQHPRINPPFHQRFNPAFQPGVSTRRFIPAFHQRVTRGAVRATSSLAATTAAPRPMLLVAGRRAG
jgi:hypothetical protein